MMRGKTLKIATKKNAQKTLKIAKKNAKNCQNAKNCKKIAIFLKIAKNRGCDFPEVQVPSPTKYYIPGRQQTIHVR